MFAKMVRNLRVVSRMSVWLGQPASLSLKRLFESLRVMGPEMTPVRMAAFLTFPVIGSGTFKATKQTKDLRQNFLQRLDELDATYRHEDEYTALERHMAENDGNMNNPELLWRMARTRFHQAQRPGIEKQKRKTLLDQALRDVQKSLEMNDRNPTAHVWCALITEAAVMYRSIDQQVRSAGIIRKHLDCALQTKPQDAMAHLSAAIWCYNIARLSWIERNVAKAICPSFPASTWEEAMKHFDSGFKASPGSVGWRHLLVGARCCLKLGENDRARALLRRALDIPVRTIDDVIAHKEASSLMKNLQVQKSH